MTTNYINHTDGWLFCAVQHEKLSIQSIKSLNIYNYNQYNTVNGEHHFNIG